MRWLVVSCLLLCLSQSASSSSFVDTKNEILFTLHLNLDSKMTCFYQPLRPGMSLSVYVDPSVAARLAIRLTSPSGDFSEWEQGDGKSVHMQHSVTENGDYEICVSAPYEVKILFHVYAFDPNYHSSELDKLAEQAELDKNFTKAIASLGQHLYKIFYSIKFYNQISVRDEALQQSNADFIKSYVVVFCISSIIVALTEVTFVRRMFRTDPSRIRI
ncbi:hypothetical protein Q1695_010392 [Nippostrongylus brasiliensis]|nr:hypothetical protein Q1695_010392 [Nippostrongylus brasiliensis]